ncbi:hypothetical protein JCM7447_14590 [Corynebacterium amycolatum]
MGSGKISPLKTLHATAAKKDASKGRVILSSLMRPRLREETCSVTESLSPLQRRIELRSQAQNPPSIEWAK